MMTDTAPAVAGVELVRVSKVFPSGVVGIEEVSLNIHPGEFVSFLGPSGSGKTTSLNTIAGFIRPTSGSVFLSGREVTQLPANKRNLGMVFQNYALFPHLTVAQNVAFGLRYRGIARATIASRVDEALHQVRLTGYSSRRPKELSGGQQQRVALARALVYRPPILLMDEPLGALDKQLRDQMQREIARLHRELGTTFVFVTHDQSEALALSDRIALFHHGRMVQLGTPEELYQRPNSVFAAEFLGESTSFTGERVGPGALRWAGEILHGVDRSQASTGKQATLVVRPEHLKISDPMQQIPAGHNQVTGRVSELTYLGSHRRVAVELNEGTRVVLEEAADGDGSVGYGESVLIHWSPNHGVLVSGTAE